MATVVFDLDGTVICSKHRYFTLPDGSIDLPAWREHCTPELIAKDSLLPLARSMRTMYAAGHTVVICTARVMEDADVAFLENNHLPYHTLLSRDGNGDDRPDAKLKVDKLTAYVKEQGFASIAAARLIMFDDNLRVIDAMRRHGVTCIDAIKENWRLAV